MIYAIGDIHGQKALLKQALSRIEADGGADAPVVFLGDYVDRGPDSRGVLDLLAEGCASGRNWICLRGNHDRMFQWFLEDTPRHDPHLLVGFHWLHDRIGGRETLGSYGVYYDAETRLQDVHAAAMEFVPDRHRAFLQSLPNYHETAEFLFVHAGIRPGVPLAQQTEEDLVWIRRAFHDAHDPHPWIVVHGHTPVDKARHYGNRVNLDTGAGYGKALSVAVFEEGRAFLLGRWGRKELTP